jgi:predicted GIY-YIG superfamily endonuclease
MYYVYAIKSITTGKIYIGQTDDIEKRLRQHNDISLDKSSFTKLQGEKWELVYKEELIRDMKQ